MQLEFYESNSEEQIGINMRIFEYRNIQVKTVDLIKSLADPTRLRIVHLLACRGPEVCVCDFVAVFGLPQATISRHLMQLRHVGIVRDRREGTWMHYSLARTNSPFHGNLMESIKTAAADEPVLKADLLQFDKLRSKSKLACCAAPDPSKASTEDSARQPARKRASR